MRKLVLIFFVLYSVSAYSQYDRVILPEGNYPYWPTYYYIPDVELKTVIASEWNDSNLVKEGWDWSMPPSIIPSPRSAYGLQRAYDFNEPFIKFDLKYRANSVGDLWVKWRDIEKTKDNFDFTALINRLKQAQRDGLKVNLRILSHSKARGSANDPATGEAPLWLVDLGCTLLPKQDPKDNLNFNPAHPKFHERYLKLISEIAKTEIPGLVKNMYIGYASSSFGDEGIGPYGEGNSFANDTVKHVRERLDAWENCFKGMETKIYMGGACDYGFRKGYGARRGFVEMYHYNIPNADLGSYVDNNGYLRVDENAPLIKYKCFNGEVNEEYSPSMASVNMDYRFGISTKSFPYRYFISMLRTLQMQCTYVHDDGRLIPEMMPFIALELGRTVEDAPDVWSFLNTFYLRKSNYANNDWQNPARTFTSTEIAQGIETKNYERWLYQRDALGYETSPAVPVQMSIRMWMIQPDKYFDYMARAGKKIGFDIDDRWNSINDSLAIKVSFFDNYAGDLNLVYNNGSLQTIKVCTLTGDGKLKTATIFIPKIVMNSLPNNFDFALEAGATTEKIVVSMVRVIESKKEVKVINTSGVNGTAKLNFIGNSFEVGDSITAMATPDRNYKFVNWTENGVEVSIDPNYSFAVTDNRNLVANFEPIQTVCTLPWITPDLELTSSSLKYYTPYIDISCASSVELFMRITENSGLENTDTLQVIYIVDGTPTVAATKANDFDVVDVKIPVITGSILEVIVRGTIDESKEAYVISNLRVWSNDRTNQTITSSAIPSKTFGDADFSPGFTSSSSLAVAYSSSNTKVAAVVGGNIRITGAGTTNITASQAGNAYFHAAPTVVHELQVAKANQTINFAAMSPMNVGDVDFSPASASSGLPVSYSSSNINVATILKNNIHLVSAGSTDITASQTGNANYNAAASLVHALTVNPQIISGLAEYRKDDNEGLVQVFPNPVTRTLYINHAEGSTIRIFNMQCQLIYNKSVLGNQSQIDVVELKSGGLIFVHVTSGDNTSVFKVSVLK